MTTNSLETHRRRRPLILLAVELILLFNFCPARCLAESSKGHETPNRTADAMSGSVNELDEASAYFKFLTLNVDGVSTGRRTAADEAYDGPLILDSLNATRRNSLSTTSIVSNVINIANDNESDSAPSIYEESKIKSANNGSCQLVIDDFMFKVKVKDQISSLKLVEFRLSLLNDTENVFETGFTHLHKANRWSRVTPYGQKLLSLAFNYGILSLMTLTVGTNVTNVVLRDQPQGCYAALDEEERVLLMREMMMNEFVERNDDKKSEFLICYEEIEGSKGFMNFYYAQFVDRCCKRDPLDGLEQCGPTNQNPWLRILYTLLHYSRVVVIFFGPLMFVSTVISLARDEFPYIVKLKEALPKKIWLTRSSVVEIKVPKHERCLDLRAKRNLRHLEHSIANFYTEESKSESLFDRTLICQIPEYNILVNYKRLLTENSVPIGLWKSIINAVFFCKMRKVRPFVNCCEEDMFKRCPCVQKPVPWISLCTKIGMFLLFTVLVPMPYYLRLVILYVFEYEEVMSRKEAARRLDLQESFENSFCHYFLPTHPFFICIYVIYAVSGLLMMTTSSHKNDESMFRRTVIRAFTDLKNLSWVSVIGMATSNFIWPFKRFGILGIFVSLIYWPVFIPVTVCICCVYLLPTVYLTFRLAFCNFDTPPANKKSYRIKTRTDTRLKEFSMENIYDNIFGPEKIEQIMYKKKVKKQNSTIAEDEIDRYESLLQKEHARNQKKGSTSSLASSRHEAVKGFTKYFWLILNSCFCVLSLYSVLLLMSECLGCLLDILVFTMMGIIVNASTMLKYVALIVIIVVYSFDSFNNVEKKYLKLNKALFSEIKSRIKDLNKVTCLPSYLQENHGFKSEEQSEQCDHEKPDDLDKTLPRHWLINDLILFVDNEDMPRIPSKLFDEVCKINVAGVPGPVYLGLLDGLKHFAKILIFIIFIFMVVLSFGNAYNMNETNQMLAALAGGSLPFILRTFMEPDKPDIEIGSVSFKSKMDEKIKNFSQLWPLHDFVFEAYKPVDEDEKGNEAKKEKADDAPPPTDYNSFRRPTQAFVTEAGSMEDLSPRRKTSSFMLETMNSNNNSYRHQPVSKTTSNANKVKFEFSLQEETETVDYLIYLPEKLNECPKKSTPVDVADVRYTRINVI